MKRLIVVYNPRSSRFADVKLEVLGRVRELNGFLVGRFEVMPTNLDDNITRLGEFLKDGDMVLSAGGDATGVICANAILTFKRDVVLSVLPYGNFNDLSRSLGTRTFDDVFLGETSVRKFYPLEIRVDGKFFRYATCYVTIGMTAEAVQLYDSPKMRKKLKSKFGRNVSSYTQLAKWYFKNRRNRIFIPEFKLNGIPQSRKITDYAAVNGKSMAKVMRGGEDYRDAKYFRSEVDKLASFYRLSKLMARSILSRVPGVATECDTIEFVNPADVMLQAEGESVKFEGIHEIRIRKGGQCLKMIES